MFPLKDMGTGRKRVLKANDQRENSCYQDLSNYLSISKNVSWSQYPLNLKHLKKLWRCWERSILDGKSFRLATACIQDLYQSREVLGGWSPMGHWELELFLCRLLALIPLLLVLESFPIHQLKVEPNTKLWMRRIHEAFFGSTETTWLKIFEDLGCKNITGRALDAVYTYPDWFLQMCTPGVEYTRTDAPSSNGFAGGLPKGHRDPMKEPPKWWEEVVKNPGKKDIVFVCQGNVARNLSDLTFPTMKALKDREWRSAWQVPHFLKELMSRQTFELHISFHSTNAFLIVLSLWPMGDMVLSSMAFQIEFH
jgi:hypothetical protein